MLELILTALLMFVILGVSTGAREKGITAGIVVGSVIGLEAMFAGPICGASKCTGTLAHDIRQDLARIESARRPKANCDRGINVRAGNISQAVDHSQHDQAEGKRNPHMRDASSGDFVNNDRASSRENEREGPETFSREFFPHLHRRRLADFFNIQSCVHL